LARIIRRLRAYRARQRVTSTSTIKHSHWFGGDEPARPQKSGFSATRCAVPPFHCYHTLPSHLFAVDSFSADVVE
jgi:hypothetical protein